MQISSLPGIQTPPASQPPTGNKEIYYFQLKPPLTTVPPKDEWKRSQEGAQESSSAGASSQLLNGFASNFSAQGASPISGPISLPGGPLEPGPFPTQPIGIPLPGGPTDPGPFPNQPIGIPLPGGPTEPIFPKGL
ncbi:MAG: hypothetical protein KF760_33525 [Candidatus Eremiobacteraeota bacterium]|nr:hypothetical protein [Candidatus Eremiobacteraeota bacterium]